MAREFFLAAMVTAMLGCGGGESVDLANGSSGDGGSAGSSNAGGAGAAVAAGGGGGAGMAGGAAGGAGGGGTPAAPTVCDGSQRLRFRTFVAPQLSRELLGSAVRVENGYNRFQVDGTCHYWTSTWAESDVVSRDREVREGQVTPEEAALLDATFDLAGLPKNLDDCPVGDWPDQSLRVFAAEGTGVACRVGGPAFENAWKVASTLASAWWTRGTPVTGGVRISVVRSPGVGTQYPWTLATKLAPLELPPEQMAEDGVSTLLEDPAEVAKLRALRATYLDERSQKPGAFKGGPQFTDEGSAWYVYMRDTTPYEDEHGLLPFWPPP